MKKITIEACVASVDAAVAAEKGGADRLELNFALELDGLTPSMGLMRQVAAACSLPVIVMIRPHGYGFDYTEYEFEAMLDDIDQLLDAGAAGIATGFLHTDHTINAERTRKAVERVGDKECVIHRAFDVTPSMTEALERLIDCGVHRVLTSGQQATAPTGTTELKQLVDLADGRIEILPGAGVKPSNVADLIQKSGCTQVHGTFRAPAESVTYSGLDKLKAQPPAGTHADVVAEVRRIVDKL